MRTSQGLYASAGILTAQPVLPPQTIKDGMLRVSLIEARVGRVLVEGLERILPDFLRRTITLEPGVLPDYDRIDRDLRIYDSAPCIAFRPGKAPGTADAIILSEAPRRRAFTLSTDNCGREETGEAQATLARDASLTGRARHAVRTQGVGGGALGVVWLLVPRWPRRRPGGGEHRLLDAQVIADSFSGVDIVSDTISGALTCRRPFRVGPSRVSSARAASSRCTANIRTSARATAASRCARRPRRCGRAASST